MVLGILGDEVRGMVEVLGGSLVLLQAVQGGPEVEVELGIVLVGRSRLLEQGQGIPVAPLEGVGDGLFIGQGRVVPGVPEGVRLKKGGFAMLVHGHGVFSGGGRLPVRPPASGS